MRYSLHRPSVRLHVGSCGSPLQQRRARAAAARVGGYRLCTRLRAGGMAEVYLAESEAGELVALKRLLPHLDGDARFRAWLREEARLAERLRHPNVVRVRGYDEDRGRGFLIMEFVDGLSLGHVRARSRLRHHAAPLGVVASLVTQAAAAIDYVHRAGVIHGDVTPANMMVTLGDRRDPHRRGAGLLKLVDFGVAREADQPLARPLAGNPGYVAPEQAAGLPGDARSDVFALGVCAWELLAGRRLFSRGQAEATLAMVRRAEIPALPPLRHAPQLDAALRAALARDPDARLPSARALGDAFLDWLVQHDENEDALGDWLGTLDRDPLPPHASIEITETALLA